MFSIKTFLINHLFNSLFDYLPTQLRRLTDFVLVSYLLLFLRLFELRKNSCFVKIEKLFIILCERNSLYFSDKDSC